MTGSDPLLTVEDLWVEFDTSRGTVAAVNGIDFEVRRGETFGIVGESGAGKSVTSEAVMQLIDAPGRITEGKVIFDGTDLTSADDEDLRRIRGNKISMIFQDPMSALNPTYTVERQISDVIREHENVSRSTARNRVNELFNDVGIPEPEARLDDYPHQFSGGMQQRVLIAMALACDPDFIIADEPTTALDVTIQAQILELLENLQEERDLTIQLITHDISIIAQMCDRVAVMYAGEIVEMGDIYEVMESPCHPYTLGLMTSVPYLTDEDGYLSSISGTMPEVTRGIGGCIFRDRCPYERERCSIEEPILEVVKESTEQQTACLRYEEIDFDADDFLSDEELPKAPAIPGEPGTLISIEGLHKRFRPESVSGLDRLLGRDALIQAVNDVSLRVKAGQTLGLVGESGCGKTTLARCLIRLYEPDAGTVVFADKDLSECNKSELKEVRSDMQYIFQNPFSSLNPRKRVLEIIGRPMEIHGIVETAEEKREKVGQYLEDVGLERDHMDRYPHEFSGGQRQRIGIARALAVEPEVVVADEPVSALDVSVQAQILNLLQKLQYEYNLTYIFIAHDLKVVHHISDYVAVMYLGEIIEYGTVDDVFEPPYHPYTEMLLSSIPQPQWEVDDAETISRGSPPSPLNPPTGCNFHTRCPYAENVCARKDPEQYVVEDGHTAACHIFDVNGTMEEQTVPELTAEQQEAYDMIFGE